MNPTRALLIVPRARHIATTEALIADEKHLGRDLRAEKRRLVVPGLLPLGEILRDFSEFDASWRLRVTGMDVMRRTGMVASKSRRR